VLPFFIAFGHHTTFRISQKPKKTQTTSLAFCIDIIVCTILSMIGTYYLTGTATYKAEGQNKKLLISKRKHARPGITSSFILLIDDTGKREYCSSLYPTKQPDTYNIEYQGKRYLFIHTEAAVNIMPE